jgi:hypothetical protein
MRKQLLIGALVLAAGVAIIGWRTSNRLSSETFSETSATPPEAAPLCPWRDPESDLKRFFPEATSYERDTRILSGRRLELAERLGRAPTGDENALRIYRVYRVQTPLGTILTRRVKGDYGAIELVLAADTNRSVVGLRLQRLREPESIAEALQDPAWQRAFMGKHANDAWHIGSDLPEVPAVAGSSAEVVVKGVRDLLILLTAADQAQAPSLAEIHHH